MSPNEVNKPTLSYIDICAGTVGVASLDSTAMRTGLALVMVAGLGGTAWAKPSNPAFLGVGMQDLGGAGAGPCMITEVTRNSGAEAGGLEPGDVVETIDGTLVANCDVLLASIQARLPNDRIAIAVARDARSITLATPLWPRDEVLRRRGLVGQPASGELTGIEDQSAYDLGTSQRPTIVGWFSPRCGNCERAFQAVSRWTRERNTGAKARPVAVFGAMADDLTRSPESLVATQRAIGVPLLLADADTWRTHAITEPDRIYFMVVDCRGVVQHLAPISPDDDDTDAALDDLFAAAEQAVHAR